MAENQKRISYGGLLSHLIYKVHFSNFSAQIEDHEIWHTFWHLQGFSTFSRVKLLCLLIDRINLDSNVIKKRDHFQNAVLSLMQLLWQSWVFDYEICQYRLKWSILYLLLITWGITVVLKLLYAKILCKMQVSMLWT